MSKQEKLAAVIHRVQEYAHGVGLVGPLGTRVKDAYCEYESTPDDPPQPPEMPEVVRALLSHLKGNVWYSQNISDGVISIEAHYARPLKLEVDGVYEDDAGQQIKLFWQDKKDGEFLGVELESGDVRRYIEIGNGLLGASRLIREVTK